MTGKRKFCSFWETFLAQWGAAAAVHDGQRETANFFAQWQRFQRENAPLRASATAGHGRSSGRAPLWAQATRDNWFLFGTSRESALIGGPTPRT